MPQTLAEFLDTWQQELIKRWTGALRETAAGASLSQRQLEDRLLTYLRRLSEALAESDPTAPSPAALAETQRAAAEHGEQRLELGYDIAAVVRDYAALPATLQSFFRDSGFQPSGEEVLRLSSFLVESIATAAHAYSLERDAKVREAAAQHTGFLVHDLRQPLQSLRLRFNLLERRGGALSHDDTRLIWSALESLSDQVDGALLKSRLEALPAPQMETVAVRALLDDLTNLVMPIAEAKGVSISVECESELALEADPRLLNSALSNLVHNGIKFSEAGTVSLRARATKPGKVVFEVEDACGGLPPGVTEKLFDPFVQLGEDRSGFGLGLALARRVADLHGGALRVHDLPGRGCVFVLELPIRHLESLQ